MFITRNSTFLRFSLNRYITFQSCRITLLLSFFTKSICVSAIVTIIAQDSSTSTVQIHCFKSISQKFGKMLNIFALIFLIPVIQQFNTFCIPAFLTVISIIFTRIVTLVLILFIPLIFNMYIKLTCILEIFINFLSHVFISFFSYFF